MRIGPKYKIARRLGAPVFEKTQTQKFALRESRSTSNKKRNMRPRSDFGLQLLEKQKARFTYGITEKQLRRYVTEAIAKKDVATPTALYAGLETRLDNIVYRMGFAPTRSAARQAVSHGHIAVDGIRTNIASRHIYPGELVAIRTNSLNKGTFGHMKDKEKTVTVPAWLVVDSGKGEGQIKGEPNAEQEELLFDLNAIVEFYNR